MPLGDDVVASPEAVLSMIDEGEGPRLEFKSSLRVEVPEGAVNKALTKSVVKTLAALLNSDGGALLIGVSDDGEILGVSADMESLTKKSEDGFQLTLRTALGVSLGADVSSA